MNKSEAVAIIRSLLSSSNKPYGIYNLNKDFKNETGIDIPLFGYGNIGDFLNSIPDTVKVTGIYPAQQISLVSNEKSAHIVSLVKRQKIPSPKHKTQSKWKPSLRELALKKRTEEAAQSKSTLEKPSPNKLNDKTSCSFENFMSLKYISWMGGKIPAINVNNHIKVGEYAEVIPCWISRPNKFYFHFRKFKKEFNRFSEKLQLFYNSHGEIPYIACDMVKSKQPCAVFHNVSSRSKWYRGEIVNISHNSGILVNFVDYGCSVEILKENIKYLHHDFRPLPKQAVLGYLANIKPSGNEAKWSIQSIKRFRKLAFEKDLIGGVVNINNKDNCVGMALSSTEGSEIHINDTLVSEGYAEFDISISRSDLGDMSNKEDLCKGNFNSSTESPVYFFSYDSFANMRLRKMFSDL